MSWCYHDDLKRIAIALERIACSMEKESSEKEETITCPRCGGLGGTEDDIGGGGYVFRTCSCCKGKKFIRIIKEESKHEEPQKKCMINGVSISNNLTPM